VDLEEIPESIRGELIFHPVERLDEAMGFAFPPAVKTDRLGEGAKGQWHRLPACGRPFPSLNPQLHNYLFQGQTLAFLGGHGCRA